MAAGEPESKKQRTDEKPKVLYVLGGPGSGKGTQSELVLKNFSQWDHISAGDVLRAEKADPESKDGELINSIIKEGKLVPTSITLRLIQKAMAAKMETGKTMFLLDGFPRNEENYVGWQENVGDAAVVCGVLFLDAKEEEMEKRLLERGKTSGRSDDNAVAIQKRFKIYENDTRPIIDRYRKMGLVYEINGNPPIEEVWTHTQRAIREVEAKVVEPMELRRQLWSCGGLRQTGAAHAIFRGGPTGQAPQFRLRYFCIRGLAELPQLLLEEGGVPYEMEILGAQTFSDSKSSCGPFGRMPLLVNHDGKGADLAQTGAITRFLAAKLGFAGADEVEKAHVDMVYCQFQDTFGNGEQYSAKALAEAAGVEIPTWRTLRRVNDFSLCQRSLATLQCFEELLEKSGTGFLVGSKLSYADVALFLQLFELDEADNAIDGWAWPTAFPQLGKFLETMSARSAIKAFVESPRRMPRIAPPNYVYVEGKLCPKP